MQASSLKEIHSISAQSDSSKENLNLSYQFWDLDWSKFSPCRIDCDTSFEVCSADKFHHFIEGHYQEIFEKNEISSRFLNNENLKLKRDFIKKHADKFCFIHKGKTVGVYLSHPHVFESHTTLQKKTKEGQHYKDKYLLRPGELLKLFPNFRVLKYEEPIHNNNFTASIILQKPKI